MMKCQMNLGLKQFENEQPTSQVASESFWFLCLSPPKKTNRISLPRTFPNPAFQRGYLRKYGPLGIMTVILSFP
jgi:hypothetical protein